MTTIMIIRHGEKPSNSDDHTLSVKGHMRADALPPLFVKPRADLARPTFIFASKGDTTSMRMVQTALPTANALKISIDSSLDSENAVTKTAQLLANQALAGQVVLAVIEHSALPAVASALVKALGGKWNAKTPSSWPDDDFSTIYKFVGDGKNWTFSKLAESVLPGDPGYQVPLPTDPPPAPIPPVATPPVVVSPPVEPKPTPPPTVPPSSIPLPPVTTSWWDVFVAWVKRLLR
jgi:hypothetical protein